MYDKLKAIVDAHSVPAPEAIVVHVAEKGAASNAPPRSVSICGQYPATVLALTSVNVILRHLFPSLPQDFSPFV